MTEQLKKFAYGGLAGRFLESEESKDYVTGALDMFKKDYVGNEVFEVFAKAVYNTPEAINSASKFASNVYLEKLKASKGSDFLDWYSSTLKGLSEEESSKINKILTSHGDKTLGDISLELTKAKYILQNPEKDKISEEDKKKASELQEKYQNFLYVQNLLENFKMEELRPNAVNEYKQRTLKDLTSKL